ncbi:MAG: PIN domain-containing protein [Actinomycetes bacterium]
MAADVILLDTHVVVWLYAGERNRFPHGARQLIEDSDLAVSPIVEVELAYLNEIGRVNESAASILGDLGARLGLVVAQISFGQVCAEAVNVTWTRDPFDRLQAAHAITKDVPLLTKDTVIREHLHLATWPD